MDHGKLFVIEGSDGSGKQTQTRLLAERIGRATTAVAEDASLVALDGGTRTRVDIEGIATFAFPRYGEPAAHLLQRYLGRNMEPYLRTMSPHQASLCYAADRLDWAVTDGYALLASGTHVILDRYVLSNLAHQGARIPNFELRRLFYDWCLNLEFGDLALPKPDLTVVLHVDVEVSLALIEKRGLAKDTHEADAAHLRAASAGYMELADLLPGLGHKVTVVECMREPDMTPADIRAALAGRDGIGAVLLSETEIHERVWAAVEPALVRQPA